MQDGLILTTLGALLLVGLVVDWLGARVYLPRVTLLLLFGFAIGSGGLGLLPERAEEWFPLVTKIALVMIGFLLGERFTPSRLREHGVHVIGISIVDVLGTLLVIGIGLLALGMPADLALLLGAIAAATAPAATYDVVKQYDAAGPLTDTLLGIVAIDDAWGLLVFSFALAFVAGFTNGDGTGLILLRGAWEVGGAVLLGAALGVPTAFLTHRIRPGEPTLLEALGVVLLCGGLATLLDVSFILAAMVLGAVTAALGRHHERPFHEIEHIEWPFMVLFFVLAGASLEVPALAAVGGVGAAYIVLRVAGRLIGATTGAWLTGAEPPVRRWIALSLLPQAGVTLGMALVVRERFPEVGATVLPLVIGSTVLFEVLGPVFIRLALVRAGEIRSAAR